MIVQYTPLNKATLALLDEMYKQDATSLHDVVSDVVDALFEFNGWATSPADHSTSSATLGFATIMLQLENAIVQLDNATGIPQPQHIRTVLSPQLIHYAIGRLLMLYNAP